MPYSVGAFALFGLGALPAGRLGDLWGRRIMMIIFFFGMGAAALLTALTQNAWQLAAALTLIGAFAAIYHPVGIPMLVQNVPNPGRRDRRQRARRQSRHRRRRAGDRLPGEVDRLARRIRRARARRDRVRHRVRDHLPEGDRSAVQAQGRQGQGGRCRPRCWCARSRS